MSTVESESPTNPPAGSDLGEAGIVKPLETARSGGRIWGFLALGVLVGALGSWLAAESVLSAYRSQTSPKLKPVQDEKDALLLLTARVNSGRLAYVAVGGVLPLCLGIAAGLAGGSMRRSLVGAGIGALGGIAIAALATSLALPAFYKSWEPSSFDMTVPLMTHGAIWSSIGVAVGLAIGIGLGTGGSAATGKAIVGGFFGAIAVTALYEVVGGIAFPSGKTELPFADSMLLRAMSIVLLAIMTAAGAMMTRAMSFTRPALREAPVVEGTST